MKWRATAEASGWAVSARLRVPHLLGTATLEPRGMAPNATLIVRRLRDPLPRGLMTDPESIRASHGWDNAAQASMTDFYRHACRPAFGAVPGTAPSVLFADQAELLACLARDLLLGVAHSHWWWRAILRTLPSGAVAALLSSLLRDDRYVPAALAHLAARGDACWVLGALTPSQALSVLETVTRVFDLPTLRGILQSSVLEPSVDPPLENRLDSIPPGDSAADSPHAPQPPWSVLVPNLVFPIDFGIERSALLGVSLALQISPSIVRSIHFSRTFANWRRSVRIEAERLTEERYRVRTDLSANVLALSRSSRVNTKLPLEGEIRAATPAMREHELPEPYEDEGSDFPAGSWAGRAPMPPDQAQAASPTPEQSSATAQSGAAAVPIGHRLEIIDPPGYAPPPGYSRYVESVSGSRSASAAAWPVVSEPKETAQPVKPVLLPEGLVNLGLVNLGDPVQTELGGVLFLISMMKALRLPASLRESCGCDLQIGSWELLELVARGLLGARDPDLAFDPLWKSLAVLDSRAPERAAGADFTGAFCYRLPQPWIDALPGQVTQLGVCVRGCRVELWHPPGLLLSDRDFGRQPTSALIQEETERVLNRVSRTCLPARHLPRPWSGCDLLGIGSVSPQLRQFLAFLMPYLRWRLAGSLGLGRVSSRVLAEAVLLRPATVWLTSSHVDMVMDLSQAAGRIRLAGLDADPGWLPDFGRVVKFHYRAMSTS